MDRARSWLLYGANGYTGALIAREARRRGLSPILAGVLFSAGLPLAGVAIALATGSAATWCSSPRTSRCA